MDRCLIMCRHLFFSAYNGLRKDKTMGRKKVKEKRKQRSIRLTDFEWEMFKRYKMLDEIKQEIKEKQSL